MKIRLEPRKHFDRAIVGKAKDGRLIYSYYLLLDVCAELYGDEKNPERMLEDAEDWVSYNIIGLDPLQKTFKISYAQKHIR